jgi:hypothetical protein
MTAKKLFEWMLNGLTILTALLLMVLFGKRYVVSDFQPAPVSPAVGSRMMFAHTDESRNQHILLLALRDGCPFCEASAPFYRDLLRSNGAMLAFLKKQGLSVADVQHVSFDEFGIKGTPTLVLVGADGRVQATWAGQLSPEQESEVFKKLRLRRLSDSSLPAQGGQIKRGSKTLELAESLRTQPIIDLRPRPDFQKGHIDGAINIPLDELEVRALHEVPSTSDVLLYCGYRLPCETKLNAQGVSTYCTASETILRNLGYHSLTMLDDDLAEMEIAGVKLISGVSMQ